jgi:type IV pilus assembly protein PilC
VPVYSYNAVTLDGKKKSGTLEADNPQKLAERLRDMDLYVSDFKVKGGSKTLTKSKLKATDLSDMCRQIGTMVGSGVVIARAVDIIRSRQGIDKNIKAIYDGLYNSLRQGMSLSEAMADQGNTFPKMLINMIIAGESSGTMDQTLMRMAEHYDKEERLNSQIKSATTYPKILIFIIVAVIIILFAVVLPTFFETYESMDMELPTVTKIMVGLSNFITKKWFIYIPVIVGIFFGWRVLNANPDFVLWKDTTKVHMPKIGPLMRIIYTARFARTIASLYASGIPLVDCLTIAAGTVGNTYIEKQVVDCIKDVKGGASVSEVVRTIDGFDSKLAATILIGEETGKLDEMLLSTADQFEYESEQATGRLTALIEPVMLVVMAVLVGSVLIGVIVPMYGMYDGIDANAGV